MATTTPSYQDTGVTRAAQGRSVRRTFTETKAFYKTSEFLVWLGSVAGVLVVTYTRDPQRMTNWHAWLLIAVLSAAYMLSRGVAKAGAPEPYTDRDEY